jgi:hypothetical protein
MDFLEHWFGVAPDGGNGALELAMVLAAGLLLAARVVGRLRGPRPRERRSRGGYNRI